MTREEIDVLWQQAAKEAFDKGETYRRYEFANLILEKAAEIKQEVVFVFTDDATGLSKEACDVIEYYAAIIRSMKV